MKIEAHELDIHESAIKFFQRKCLDLRYYDSYLAEIENDDDESDDLDQITDLQILDTYTYSVMR